MITLFRPHPYIASVIPASHTSNRRPVRILPFTLHRAHAGHLHKSCADCSP